MNEIFEETQQKLEDRIEQLDEAAKEVAGEWYGYQRNNNKDQKTWQERSVLFLRYRRRGSSISLEWRRMQWKRGVVGKKKEYILQGVYTKKRGNVGYTMGKILEDAQPWEKDKMIEIEERAREIRRDLSIALALLAKLKQLKKWGERQEMCVSFAAAK